VENLAGHLFIHCICILDPISLLTLPGSNWKRDSGSGIKALNSSYSVLSLTQESSSLLSFYSHSQGDRKKHYESKTTVYINLPFPINCSTNSKCMGAYQSVWRHSLPRQTSLLKTSPFFSHNDDQC
jgi:hypothetical protein